MVATGTEKSTEAQQVRRSKASTVLTGILAVFNIFLAFSPPFEVVYLAMVGGVGGASVVMEYTKLPWARHLSIGAALMSLTAAVSAIISSLIIYPFALLSFLSMNLIHFLYLFVSIVSLLASLRGK